MRRLAVVISLACLSWTAHAATAEPPDEALSSKVLEERDDGQWHGHRHWLYDKENQPETNAMASNPSDCAEYRIRVPKAAGAGTEIKHIQKCDLGRFPPKLRQSPPSCPALCRASTS